MTGHIASDANISITESSRITSNRIGDVVLDSADYISQLNSSVLGATILRWPSNYGFRRHITNTEGKDISYMSMERPVPDPDRLFHDLAKDPVLATFPTGLRSAADPASLIPSRTGNCGRPTECFLIVPVSITNGFHNLSWNLISS